MLLLPCYKISQMDLKTWVKVSWLSAEKVLNIIAMFGIESYYWPEQYTLQNQSVGVFDACHVSEWLALKYCSYTVLQPKKYHGITEVHACCCYRTRFSLRCVCVNHVTGSLNSLWRISPLRWTLLTAALEKSPLGLSSCLIEAELWPSECAQCGLCPPVGHLQSFRNAAVVVHAHLYKTTHHKHKTSKPRRCRAPLLPLSPCSEHDSCRLEMRRTLNAQRSLPLYEV